MGIIKNLKEEVRIIKERDPRLWRLHYLRQGADAREAVPGPIRSGLPAVPGLSGNSPCGAVSLPGGGRRNPSGVPENHCQNRGRRGHGGTAQGVSNLRRTVPPGVHFDARRENHAAKLHKGDVNHDQRSHRQDRQ